MRKSNKDPRPFGWERPRTAAPLPDADAVPCHAYFDVSFVDDVAVAIHAETLTEVEGLIKLVVESFHAAARARGFRGELQPGQNRSSLGHPGERVQSLERASARLWPMALLAAGGRYLSPPSISLLQTSWVMDADGRLPPKGNRSASLPRHAELGMPCTILLSQATCWSQG